MVVSQQHVALVASHGSSRASASAPCAPYRRPQPYLVARKPTVSRPRLVLAPRSEQTLVSRYRVQIDRVVRGMATEKDFTSANPFPLVIGRHPTDFWKENR